MDTQRTTRRLSSKREREHEELLERALTRSDIRDVMRVYDNWRVKDRGMNAYRAATKQSHRTATTDSSNIPKKAERPL